jgi:hypothetical protein
MPKTDKPVQAACESYSAYYHRLHQWEVDNGQWCYRCGHIASYLSAPGYRKLCSSCENLDLDKGEVTSGTYIRCPKCGHQFNPFETEEYHVFEDGEHEVTCGSCDHTFEVTTSVSYTFASPARVEEGEPEDEPEEEEDDE